MSPFGLVAKWIPRRPPEAKIVGSSPIKVDFFFFFIVTYTETEAHIIRNNNNKHEVF